MATLTIIKDDKWVSVDGLGLHLDEVVLPSNVHAVQWDGSAGWIEYNDGTHNKSISSISDYSTITDDHATKKAANEAAATKAANDQKALEDTYTHKRKTAYAPIQEQLDQQYWDAVNGTTIWKDAIAKVKSDNPKS